MAPGRAVAEPAVPGVPAPEPDAGVPELVVQGPAPAAREPAEPALAGPVIVESVALEPGDEVDL